MIKGVSKQILEVTNPDNPYFERIIFFVKSEHQSTDRRTLQHEAEQLATTSQRPPRLKVTKKQLLSIIASCLIFATVSSGLTLLVSTFF